MIECAPDHRNSGYANRELFTEKTVDSRGLATPNALLKSTPH
jgi:hypothetical protein